MSDREGFVHRVLASACAEPAQALVSLWHYLRDHRRLERGLDRANCEREAVSLLAALQTAERLPVVHPAAAVRALDLFLADAVQPGQPVQVRSIELPADQGGGRYWLVDRRRGWISRLAERQPGHIEYWMRHHQVAPAMHRGIEIGVLAPSHRLWEALSGAVTPFAAGGFLDGVLPDWSPASPHHCRRLVDAERRWGSVEAVLEEAARRDSSIIILPELTVDPDVRQRIRVWLREHPDHPFALVVAGSFHEPHPDSAGRTGLGIARTFDAWGDEVLTHVKLRPMRATRAGVPADEDLESGARVDLVWAPFGLLGLAICLDFCDIGGSAVSDLWSEVGPALMLVPSMGDDATNHAHRERARPLVLQHATATVVASQHPEKAEACGLCWRRGSGGAEAMDHLEKRPVLYAELVWEGNQ